MKIFIAFRSPNYAAFALNVSKDDTVASVKAKLQDMAEIPPSRQRLVFACSALTDDDDTTLGDHGVTDSSTIVLVETKMEVFLRCNHRSGGGIITISGVESSDTVESFRLRVQEKDGMGGYIGIRPAQKRLILGSKQLEDGHTLADYGVGEYTTIHLVCRPHNNFRTRVVELDIEDTETVGRIKERVEEAEGVPVTCQRVYYCGKELDDGRTFADCGAVTWITPVKIVCERQERGGTTTEMATKGEASVVVENKTGAKRGTDVDAKDPGKKKKKRKKIKVKPLVESEAAEVPAVKRRRFPFYLIGPELGAICPSSCDTGPAY